MTTGAREPAVKLPEQADDPEGGGLVAEKVRTEPVAVSADESGLRLDRWFRRRFPVVTHGTLERLLRTGQVRIDGRRN